MSDPGAGFEYPPVEVSWLKRDILLFAVSIGCTVDELHFLYVRLTLFLFSLPCPSTHLPEHEPQACRNKQLTKATSQELHPHFTPFPTYPIILPFKHTSADVIDFYARAASTPIPGVPRLDSRRVVDGERRIEFLERLPVSSEGGRWEVRAKVLGVYDKGKPGTVVETEQKLVEVGSGKCYARMVGQGFFVGQGGWGGPKGGWMRYACACALRALFADGIELKVKSWK